MAEDLPADIDLAEGGQLPEQGPAETPEAKTDKALDAVTKAFEEATQGREAERPADQRARDEAGRFAKEQAQAKAAEAAKQPTEQPAAATTPDTDTPGAWKGNAERAALWAGASPELRKAIAGREAEVNAGFKMYEGLGPYVRIAAEGGTSLAAAVKDYWQVEQSLRQNFGEGIRGICQKFGVDPARLGAFLSGQPAPEGGQAPAPQAQPSLTADDVARIVDQRSANAARAQQVQSFFANPEFKHANDVAPQMAALIRDKIARGEPVDLKAVYDEALYINPQTREILLTEERARLEKERIEKENAAAQKARRLGASVKPSAGPTQRPNGRMTREQAVAAALDEVMN